MTLDQILWLSLAMGAVAFLYSSVGHAGASGYIAVMTLAELEPHVIKPTALLLNILVASIGSWQFARSGHFSWSLFWPFALLAIPLAFLGGSLNLPTQLFNLLVGAVLLFSAVRFLLHPREEPVKAAPPVWLALPIGGGLGLLSGLTGTGGGIFLTPLLLMKRWAAAKSAGGVSIVFILLNSTAGLLGNFGSTRSIPWIAFPLLLSVVLAGTAGSYLGSQKFQPTTIKRLLAAVLLIASSKLLLPLIR
jgi:uncharacterized membrane protein YfcA